MIYKDLDAKFSAVHNFIIIQIVLTLVLICLVVVDDGRIQTGIDIINEQFKKISTQVEKVKGQLEIFQDSIPYDPARKKRIKDEKTGNFNEFEKGVL